MKLKIIKIQSNPKLNLSKIKKDLEKQLESQRFQLKMAKLNKDDAANEISSYQQESKDLCHERSDIDQKLFQNQTKYLILKQI
jgi:uncharacterized protein (DUF3084 family)